MSQMFSLETIGRLPANGDNVAIAVRSLPQGTGIAREGKTFTLRETVMEGHRFAVLPIREGEALTSWGLPFGIATRSIEPGDYICNPQMLEELRLRDLDFQLPEVPNFEDRITPYDFNADHFAPASQVQRITSGETFLGYRRNGRRGVGTRNDIVLIGTSSRTAGFVRQLEQRTKGLARSYANVDGIVAVAHTEGGGADEPNNNELVLRALSGFIVHPNVGAVIAVDYGTEAVTNEKVEAHMRSAGYPLDDVPHLFLSVKEGFEECLDQAEKQVREWLDVVDSTPRSRMPITELKIALQCGGSDAFSGVSGNPLAAWVAREVIRHGGSANLAETDELIGAEHYVLQNVRSVDVAQRFLRKIEAYKDFAASHGTTAEGNPTGGNKYRGLYNIVLKSIGAAQKKHADVRIDEVLDYAAPMSEPGYYFMDSPGNDLESIAGQVASGCNMIFFVTGNGSITNFPFVPTIKIVTTTKRYELLNGEMDVNAGAYLDGESMDILGRAVFEMCLDVASGKLSKGEEAGHSQVSIWRTWRQSSTHRVSELKARKEPTARAIPIRADVFDSVMTFEGMQRNGHAVVDSVGLILPTSLCAGQVARIAADRLTKKEIGRTVGTTRYVGLMHTEGCGNAGEEAQRLYTRTLIGYLTHPTVRHALLLEHGCEKTHNAYLRHAIEDLGLDPADFGWASIQLDGGIKNVLDKIDDWFSMKAAGDQPVEVAPCALSELSIGISAVGGISVQASESLARICSNLAGIGATVIVPDNAPFLTSQAFRSLLGKNSIDPTLAHGLRPDTNGFYIMETQTDHWVETLTGMGGSGVQVVAVCSSEHPVQGHPLVPVLQIASDPNLAHRFGDDFDLSFESDVALNARRLLSSIADVASRRYVPRARSLGNTDFQITRGLLGVSM